jgi:geranylgeranyl diphosphate synthase type II
MIHAYSLIHDDLPAMDDDDLRRGQPTCHKKFGEAIAILAGDALQTLAFQVLAEGYSAGTAAACCRVLARASGKAGMVGGQVDDIAWESATDSNVQRNVHSLENLHGRKTGALIRAALQIGVHAGHAGRPEPAAELLGRFDAYGQHIGLLFQITDDLLDVEGHSDQTGKRVQKDAARGKLTYPQLLGVAGSRDRARQLCEDARSLMRPLGDPAAHLAALANYVLERDR